MSPLVCELVLQLQGAGGLDNSNMVGGLQGLVELHASGAENMSPQVQYWIKMQQGLVAEQVSAGTGAGAEVSN